MSEPDQTFRVKYGDETVTVPLREIEIDAFIDKGPLMLCSRTQPKSARGTR